MVPMAKCNSNQICHVDGSLSMIVCRFTNNKINKLCALKIKFVIRTYGEVEGRRKKNLTSNERVLSCHVTSFWRRKRKKTQNVQICVFFGKVGWTFFYIDVGSGGMRYIFLCPFTIEPLILLKSHTNTHTRPTQLNNVNKIQKYSPIHTCAKRNAKFGFAHSLSRSTDRNSNKSRWSLREQQSTRFHVNVCRCATLSMKILGDWIKRNTFCARSVCCEPELFLTHRPFSDDKR